MTFLDLKNGILNRVKDFRNVFGKKIDLFSDKHKNFIEIPKLRREKHFPKLKNDIKSEFNQLTIADDIPKEQFATLDELIGFVISNI